MISRFLLSFLIFFNSSYGFAVENFEVIQKYKNDNKVYRYDLFSHLKEGNGNHFKDWKDFESYIFETEDLHKKQGIAYILSGVAITIAAGFGYSNADSSTEKIAYSLAQSLSIGAIGYGTYKYYVGNNDRSFYHVIERTESLSEEQKNHIILNFNLERDWQMKQVNWIALGTYSLIALANFVNASREDDTSTRDALYVIGGINALAAISVSF